MNRVSNQYHSDTAATTKPDTFTRERVPQADKALPTPNLSDGATVLRRSIESSEEPSSNHAEGAHLVPQSRGRKRPPPTRLQLRIRNLNKLREHRYGETMPDQPAARLLVEIVVQHLVHLPGSNVVGWLSLFARFLSKTDIAQVLERATEARKFWKAEELGRLLKLSNAEREALRITTIAPFDMSPAERAEQRKLKKRREREEKRRANGALPRAEYLATLAKIAAKPKPWVLEGISRATWYRRNRRE